MSDPRTMSDEELAVCLGCDAMRLALGQNLMHFTTKQVVEGIRICAEKYSRPTVSKDGENVEG